MKPLCRVLDDLNLTVQPFGNCVGNGVFEPRQHIVQMSLETLFDLDQWLQANLIDPLPVLEKEGRRVGIIKLP